MCAGRASFRRFCAFVNIAAIFANPLNRLFTFEDKVLSDIFCQCKIPLLMALLGTAIREQLRMAIP
jgi:hypothetical protein